MRFLLVIASITVSIPLAFAEEITTSSNEVAPESQSKVTETVTPTTPLLSTPTDSDSKSLEHFLQQNLTQIEGLMTRMLSQVEEMHEMVQQLTTAIQPLLPTSSLTSTSMPAKSPLQLHHQRMRHQIEQIQQTQDPIERNKLLQQHLQQMNAFQQMIAGKNESLNPSNNLMRNRDLINARIDKLEKRINGMYTLLEQILAHQQTSQPNP